jgi:acetyltransferase-like isoleucine patch superfamily enzyme
MEILSESAFDQAAVAFQPWLPKTPEELEKQILVKAVLKKKAGASFGKDSYVAPEARIFTQRFQLGDRSWVAAGAMIRGTVHIHSDCSVNAYANIAGTVSIGPGCRIASFASIYGFNHGFARTDIFIKDQPVTSAGVVLREDVWVGTHAVIVDGVEIGAHCVVAAGAVVTKSFPPYSIIAGNPARVIRDRLATDAKPGES